MIGEGAPFDGWYLAEGEGGDAFVPCECVFVFLGSGWQRDGMEGCCHGWFVASCNTINDINLFRFASLG